VDPCELNVKMTGRFAAEQAQSNQVLSSPNQVY